MINKTRKKIKELLHQNKEQVEILVMGWIRTRRDSKGGFSFLEINDGSCLKNLQVIVDHNVDSFDRNSGKIHTGSCVSITGKLVNSPGEGQSVELQAMVIEVYGEADPDNYPLQKKNHTFEFLREIAHLRPRTNTFGAVMRVRNRLSFAIHNFFQDRGFIYLNTPIITTNDCEGAGEMFQVTTLNVDSIPKVDGLVDYSRDFFGEKTGLTVSGQLEGEVYAMALSDIYTFGPTFRAENSNTSRHLSEFWMVEPEMAFYDLEDDMNLAEDFLRYLFKDVLEYCLEDLEFFNQQIDKTLLQRHQVVIDNQFERISYSEAVQLLDQSNKAFNYSVEWGNNLQAEHERYISEEVFEKPVIIYDYPKEIKPFYMKANSDGRTVRAMDVLLPKLGEIIGGSQREEDYNVLLNRMKIKNLNPDDYKWYLDLRRFGSAPHAGFGLGFERLVQFVTGMENIRDVIPFPRTPKNARF
jgi:asparaginyl-tRNA synthetase